MIRTIWMSWNVIKKIRVFCWNIRTTHRLQQQLIWFFFSRWMENVMGEYFSGARKKGNVFFYVYTARGRDSNTSPLINENAEK